MMHMMKAGMGIGVDVEHIDRFEKFIYNKRNLFLWRIYTPAELRYCFSRARPAEHLAVRFAAKEAVRKAFGGASARTLPSFRAVEIVRSDRGVPSVILHHRAATQVRVFVSLSHSRNIAIASAVIVSR